MYPRLTLPYATAAAPTTRNDTGKPRDEAERRRHRNVKGIVHDMGSFLILYDAEGDAMTAIPLYGTRQLDDAVSKYGLSSPATQGRDGGGARAQAEEAEEGVCDGASCATCSASLA